MARVPLLGGAYQSRSVIASAQRSVNLYPEANPPEGSPPVPVTHYLTPGLNPVSHAPIVGRVRALYRATNGDLYAVVNGTVYYVSEKYEWTVLGSIPPTSTPVNFADNGLVVIAVDGSATGYAIDMTTRSFAAITDPTFYGAVNVAYLDTFFILNRPGTPQFYISLSNATYNMLTGTVGAIYAGTITSPGTGYTDGSYASIALNGGTGTGATIHLVILDGEVTSATINAPGAGYSNSDVLTVSDVSIGAVGAIQSGSLFAAGSSYTNGTYSNVHLTGGSGTGAQATIVVSGTIVSSVTITVKGSGYKLNESLSAAASSIGGTGTGFSWEITEVAGGFVWTVDNVHGYAFDPLDIAGKTGSADALSTIAVVHGELWPIGLLTSEIWGDVGAPDFAFQRIDGAFIDHGCAAPYSLAQQDISLFWLSQDRQGEAVIIQTMGYSVKRISTHAIEQEIQAYTTISDAIGYCHQIDGHAFYVLIFPTANKTWAYELATGQWHERASIDGNGQLIRHRGNAFAFAYGVNLVGDYQNGALYAYDANYFLDDDQPIPRIRTFPHLINDGNRVEYTRFVADMEVGQGTGESSDSAPMISLRWSDTRGATFGNPVMQSMGATGQAYVSPQWRKLGMARDRIFELSWSAPVKTALNSAFVEVRGAAT